jgi:superfamily II DNA or RNA helicase
MAEPTSATSAVAPPLPDPELLARAESFTREPFVLPGEDPQTALAPGTPRRRALDAALAELAEGRDVPSTAWRREFSLMLGLERLLSQDEPRLADGTLLNPHQVDALSGTLTALLAEGSRQANGNGAAQAAAAANGASPAVGGDEEEVVGEDEEPVDFDADAESGEAVEEAPEDPNAHKRFWFEHATGAGKTVAAMGFVEASRTGGVLILTHRRNLVDQFNGELRQRGYAHRVTPPLMKGQDRANGPVTVETYQWFVRHAGNISSSYTVVICDEAHTALGEKTAAAIREWTGPIFIGMTATGALIARHVTDLFPTQTSRFDLAQAARRGVIAPLRCVRIPPGPGVRTIAKVPLRRGEVDTEFDQEMLAELLDQLPFNLAAANLYKTRFGNLPGVVYAAGVRHAYNLAEAFRAEGIKAQAVSGETPKRELAEILARYERGEIDVLINAQLLAEGWNSPRATVCFHLAPTASKRIYQQRVGRVTRRHPGKEAGIVVDFVHPATKHDDPVVTLHSLLDRDVYRGGAIVVGPVRRGRGRRIRVERRVLPVTADENRRIEVFERELWRIAVEHLDWGEQIQWAALAGARVVPSGWRRARAMLHFDKTGELKRTFLLTAVQRNKNPQLRLRALQEIAASRDPEAFDLALDEVGGWPREEKREACRTMLLALADKRIGRRDQADAWIWRIAGYTAELHEEYAVQRWPETKRLLGLLANSAGAGHARNARRLVHAARKQDRRLAAALLAAAIRYTHTPEAEEILRSARSRMARKPASLSRDLMRNFPKARRGKNRRRKRKGAEEGAVDAAQATATETLTTEAVEGAVPDADAAAAAEGAAEVAADVAEGGEGVEAAAEGAAAAGDDAGEDAAAGDEEPRAGLVDDGAATPEEAPAEAAADAAGDDAPAPPEAAGAGEAAAKPRRTMTRRRAKAAEDAEAEADAAADGATRTRRTTRRRATATAAAEDGAGDGAVPAAGADAVGASAPEAEAATGDEEPTPTRRTTRRRASAATAAEGTGEDPAASAEATEEAAPATRRTTRRRTAAAAEPAAAEAGERDEAAPRKRTTTRRAKVAAAAEAADAPASEAAEAPAASVEEEEEAKPKRRTTRRRTATTAEADAPDAATTAEEEPKPKRSTRRRTATAAEGEASGASAGSEAPDASGEAVEEEAKPKRSTRRRGTATAEPEAAQAAGTAEEEAKPKRRTTRRRTAATEAAAAEDAMSEADAVEAAASAATPRKRTTTRRTTASDAETGTAGAAEAADGATAEVKPKRRTTRKRTAAAEAEAPAAAQAASADGDADPAPAATADAAPAEDGADAAAPKRRTTRRRTTAAAETDTAAETAAAEEAAPKRTTRRRTTAAGEPEAAEAAGTAEAETTPKRRTTRRRATAAAADAETATGATGEEAAAPKRRTTRKRTAATEAEAAAEDAQEEAKPKRRTTRRRTTTTAAAETEPATAEASGDAAAEAGSEP